MSISSQVRLIVCERRGLWAALIRLGLPPEFPLRETRSLAECRAELAAAPASVLVVEITPARLSGTLDLVADAPRLFPLASIVVVGPRDSASCESLVREAGAVHFTTSPSAAAEIARLTLRHAERVPRPRTSLAAQIWESLPWPEAATT